MDRNKDLFINGAPNHYKTFESTYDTNLHKEDMFMNNIVDPNKYRDISEDITIHNTTYISFTLWDRVKILFGGIPKVSITLFLDTNNQCKNTQSNTVISNKKELKKDLKKWNS